MKQSSLLFAFASLLATPALAQTPGNLIVTRVGDGTAPLTNGATAVFLDDFTVAGTQLPSIPLPTTASGSNLPLTNSGTATSEGAISQSDDGRFLIVVGYGAAPGTAGVVSTPSATTPRVIGRIALNSGPVDTSTALSDAYSANNIRMATSLDGNQFWTAGTSTTSGGVRYVASLGATTSTQLATAPTNIRTVNIFQSQLYCGTSSTPFFGVSTVGAGLPTSSGQLVTLLPGIPAASGPSSYDFWFADASTLYVADDRTNGLGGIQKWTLVAGTWTLGATFAPATNVGCRGLTGCVEAGVVTLYATTTANTLVSVVDAPTPVITTLATAATNTAFRGVQFVRTPASGTYSGTACPNSFGTPTVGTFGGPAVAGNLNFAITASSTGPLSFVLFLLNGGTIQPIGLPVPGTPACALIFVLPDALLGTLSDPNGDALTALPIPANCSLGGATLGAQVAAFDPSLTGFGLPIGTSNALQIVIGN